MEINQLNSQSSNAAFVTPKKAEVGAQLAAPKTMNGSPESVANQQQVADTSKSEKQRLDTMIKGSQAFKNFYAVSSTKFTIFKDSTGQFVTRFTDLKDGSVTYLPEPDIIRFMERNSEQKAAIFEMEA